MQDARALSNPRNLRSWRAWEQEAWRRSGYLLLVAGVCPGLAVAFTLACTLFRPALGEVEIGLGLYLATAFALMAFAVLRLQAWRRAHPWTPPT